MSKRVVGADIGGANLKYVDHLSGKALAKSFPMWRQSDQLANSIKHDLDDFGQIDALAVTMTGELADCFLDRQQGVQHIVAQVQSAASQLSVNHVYYYGIDGAFHDAASANANVDVIAAANWHALANFVGQKVTPDALLIDIGSTTTDIIRIADGTVMTDAKTDFDRLREGSLVYVGCRRTPVCALVNRLTFQGESVEVMNEFFATIDDAHVVLSQTDPQPDDLDTADGQPRTIPSATNRLARMIGLDRRSVSHQDAIGLARQVTQAASDRIAAGITRLGLKPLRSQLVLSGHGHDLLQHSVAELPADNPAILLSDILSESCSRAAPAYAAAVLLADQLE